MVNMKNEEIINELKEMADPEYAAFSRKLCPDMEDGKMLGVRTPALKKYAHNLWKSGGCTEFLHSLPHTYFEEDQVHAFLLGEMKDFDACIEETERFLPYIDNWMTCDQFSPKVFAKHKQELLAHVLRWLESDHVYTVRYGIGTLMRHYLDTDFDVSYPELVAGIEREEYYIRMMQAWYFATALAKQYDAVIPYLENSKLSLWVHNKTIQKAVESYRITPETKAYLKTLKRKN